MSHGIWVRICLANLLFQVNPFFCYFPMALLSGCQWENLWEKYLKIIKLPFFALFVVPVDLIKVLKWTRRLTRSWNVICLIMVCSDTILLHLRLLDNVEPKGAATLHRSPHNKLLILTLKSHTGIIGKYNRETRPKKFYISKTLLKLISIFCGFVWWSVRISRQKRPISQLKWAKKFLKIAGNSTWEMGDLDIQLTTKGLKITLSKRCMLPSVPDFTNWEWPKSAWLLNQLGAQPRL